MDTMTRDHDRIADAILRAAAAPTPPTVAALAAEAHLSPAHFRRLFRRWTGLAPKTYLRHLAGVQARTLLERRSVLDASIDAGLSSPGRLHDLLVDLEAVTPGEARAGVVMDFGVHPTPLGEVVVATTERGISCLQFLDDGGDPEAVVRGAWPRAELRRDDAATADSAHAIEGALTRSLRGRPPRLVVRGTNLQVQVWRALLGIPEGRVATYGDVAASIGRPDAVRAVANAIAANPIAVLVPCHRVLRSTGELSGYRWGTDRKRALLAVETSALPTPA